MAEAQQNELIGYSLSICVSDILCGKVKEPEVTRIVASISAPTRDAFENLLNDYAESYWRDDPDEGKNIARRLYDAGKIDQPRLRNEGFMHIGNGHWKIIEAEKPFAVPQATESHVGLYDPEAVNPDAVANRREQNTAAEVTAIVQGTRAPVTVRTFKFKTPGA